MTTLRLRCRREGGHEIVAKRELVWIGNAVEFMADSYLVDLNPANIESINSTADAPIVSGGNEQLQ